jgi:hypothetical protein
MHPSKELLLSSAKEKKSMVPVNCLLVLYGIMELAPKYETY